MTGFRRVLFRSSGRAALDPSLRLRWREGNESAAVMAADQRRCLGFVYRCQLHRWSPAWWGNTGDDRLHGTAEQAANALLPPAGEGG